MRHSTARAPAGSPNAGCTFGQAVVDIFQRWAQIQWPVVGMSIFCIALLLAVKAAPAALRLPPRFSLLASLSPLVLVLVPVLLPTARMLGIDLVHFGLVVTVNMMIGMLTPPYGVLHFVMSAVTGIPVSEIIREVWFFCGVLLFALALLMFIPEITLWLPKYLGLMK